MFQIEITKLFKTKLLTRFGKLTTANRPKLSKIKLKGKIKNKNVCFCMQVMKGLKFVFFQS